MCGEEHSVWRRAYCVEKSILCGEEHIVWRRAYCVEKSILCGEEHIVIIINQQTSI